MKRQNLKKKTKKIKMLRKKTAEFLRFSFCENLAQKIRKTAPEGRS